MADPQECFFCGSPAAPKRCTGCKIARYCGAVCQSKHWKLVASDANHKAQCQAFRKGLRDNIDKADYHSYVETLPGLDDCNMFAYHHAATKERYLVDLTNRINYPLPGPKNTFFRTHEFLQALVAHGEDTEENLTRLYGFQVTPHEVYSDSQSLERTPCPWFEVIGRAWFKARIAVACGVGAPEGATYAMAMGARSPPPLPEGVPATDIVLQQLQKLNLPLSSVLETHGYGRDNLTCSICHDNIADERSDTSTVQLLPVCKHLFHQACIMDWLERNASCPLCRKIIPENIPRPPTIQEQNIAARLKQHNESTKATLRKPLSELQLASWSGTYGNTVSVMYQLSDEHDFSGGACHIYASPSGKELVVTSTSIGKIVFLSLETSPASLISSTGVGKGFPFGPTSVVYDPTDETESTIVLRVDDNIVKYRHHASSRTVPLETVWAEPHAGKEGIEYLSMDQTGRILGSGWQIPRVWISSDGKTKTAVRYEHDEDDWESFQARCLDDDNPGGGVLALPNGDIVFLQGLLNDSVGISLGLLRNEDTQIRQVPVHGLTRADLGTDLGYSSFCVSPRGDVFIAIPYPTQRLVRITDPI